MTRVKKATHALKNRKNTLKKTKGFRNALSRKERAANEALAHAGAHAFAHRRAKKRDFRALWNIRLNAAVRTHGFSYSQFINQLRLNNIAIDRKNLAHLAAAQPETFQRLIGQLNQENG